MAGENDPVPPPSAAPAESSPSPPVSPPGETPSDGASPRRNGEGERKTRRNKLRYVVALLLLIGLVGVGVTMTPLGPGLKRLIGGGPGGGGDSSKRVVATLAMVTRDVKHRDRAALDWQAARESMPLSDGDKIRTFADSTAKVSFLDGGGELDVDPQTLLTIRAPKTEGRLLVADVEVDDGRVRTTVSRSADGKDRTVRIKSGGKTVAEVTTEGSADGMADFSVVLRSDRSSRIVMHRGTAKVSSMGKTITLSEGSAVTASEGTSGSVVLSAPEETKPIAAPQLTFPAAGAVIVAITGTAGTASPVNLAWGPVEGGVKYSVEVSPDLTFSRPDDLADVESTGHAFVPSGPGVYHWRVRALDESQIPGELSAARSFTVTVAPPPTPVPTPKPKKTPKKPVLPPPSFVGTVGEPLLVKGKLAKTARKVSVNGKTCRLDRATGTYEVPLENLPAGKRILIIETIFDDGSVKHEKKEAFIKQAAAPAP